MLFFGACASTIGTIAVYPFDLIRTVLAVQNEKVNTNYNHYYQRINIEESLEL